VDPGQAYMSGIYGQQRRHKELRNDLVQIVLENKNTAENNTQCPVFASLISLFGEDQVIAAMARYVGLLIYGMIVCRSAYG
jgi:hypothetical protein